MVKCHLVRINKDHEKKLNNGKNLTNQPNLCIVHNQYTINNIIHQNFIL